MFNKTLNSEMPYKKPHMSMKMATNSLRKKIKIK